MVDSCRECLQTLLDLPPTELVTVKDAALTCRELYNVVSCDVDCCEDFMTTRLPKRQVCVCEESLTSSTELNVYSYSDFAKCSPGHGRDDLAHGHTRMFQAREDLT